MDLVPLLVTPQYFAPGISDCATFMTLPISDNPYVLPTDGQVSDSLSWMSIGG